MDRYNHDLGGDDTDETDDSPLFGSFSSYSPQYKKQNSSKFLPVSSEDINGVNSLDMAVISNDTTKTLTRPELRKLDVSLSI